MDRGPLEREEADKVRAIINKTARQRRRSRAGKGLAVANPGTAQEIRSQKESGPGDCMGSAKVPGTSTGISAQIEASTASQKLAADEPRLQMTFRDETIGDAMIWQNALLPSSAVDGNSVDFAISSTDIPSLHGLPEIQGNDSDVDSMLYRESVLHDALATWDQHSEDFGVVSEYTKRSIHGAEKSNNYVNSETDKHRRNWHSRESILSTSRSDREFSASEITSSRTGSSGPAAAHHQVSVCAREMCMKDLVLLSHYIGTVVYAQFPFSCSCTTVSREWLFLFLFRSEVVLEISLVLAESYQYLETNMEHPERAQYAGHIARVKKALLSLPSPKAVSLVDLEQKATQTIIACTSLIQTIHLDVRHFNTSRESDVQFNWAAEKF